jgi:nucleotide-binding universal stress UspA family protein
MSTDHTAPDWNEADSVPLALKALREAHDEDSAIEATDRFLWSVGDNEAGTFFPVVLTALPELERILADGGVWSQQAAIEALIDLAGTFAPEDGHETHAGVPVQDRLRAFVRALRPRLVPLAEGQDARAHGASELIELIDDLAP